MWVTTLCAVAPLVSAYPQHYEPELCDSRYSDFAPSSPLHMGSPEFVHELESYLEELVAQQAPSPAVATEPENSSTEEAIEPDLCLFPVPIKLVRNPRGHIIWTGNLHQRFLQAVEYLKEEAVPSRIHMVMNCPELSREHVASHLQKYKKKQSLTSSSPNQMDFRPFRFTPYNKLDKKRVKRRLM